MNIFKNHALSYLDSGFNVFPVSENYPCIELNLWKGLCGSSKLSRETLDKWCNEFSNYNIGVALGHGDLVSIDFDIDNDDLINQLLELLPPCEYYFRTKGWASPQRSYFYKISSDLFKILNIPSEFNLSCGQVRVKRFGSWALLPPSVIDDDSLMWGVIDPRNGGKITTVKKSQLALFNNELKKLSVDFEIDEIGEGETFSATGFKIRKENGSVNLLEREFSEYFEKTHSFKNVDGVFYIYNGKHHESISELLVKRKVNDITDKGFPTTGAQTDRFFKALNYRTAGGDDFWPTGKFINLDNGVYDISSGDLLEHDPKYNFKSVVSASLDKGANCPTWLQVLDNVFGDNEESKDYIRNLFAYILHGGDPYNHSCAVFIGEGSNGKSTILDTISYLFGNDNVSSVAIGKIGDRFALAGMENKMVNLSAEAPMKTQIASEAFKSIVGGDLITIEDKYKSARQGRITARQIFAINDFPSFGDNSKGMLRRLHFIEFKKDFEDMAEKDKIKSLKKKLQSEINGILNWALVPFGYDTFKDTGKVLMGYNATYNPVMTEFQRESDPILAFCYDCIELEDGLQITAREYSFSDIWKGFKDYLNYSGMTAQGLTEYKFRRNFKKKLNTRLWGSGFYDINDIVRKGTDNTTSYSGIRLTVNK